MLRNVSLFVICGGMIVGGIIVGRLGLWFSLGLGESGGRAEGRERVFFKGLFVLWMWYSGLDLDFESLGKYPC